MMKPTLHFSVARYPAKRYIRHVAAGTYFCKKNGYMHELGGFVFPRQPFQQRRFFRLDDSIVSFLSPSIDDVSEVIADIDAHKTGVPVLLRQYLKLGGKMLGFNVDKDFSNVLDGLVLVDLLRTERRTLARYLGEEGTRRFLGYHAEAASRAGGMAA